jgi:hypothetical protein
MAFSDQLSRLTARAKEAEDRAAAAMTKAKAELEDGVRSVSDPAHAEADQPGGNTDNDTSTVPDGWRHMQRTWTHHVATCQEFRRHAC